MGFLGTQGRTVVHSASFGKDAEGHWSLALASENKDRSEAFSPLEKTAPGRQIAIADGNGALLVAPPNLSQPVMKRTSA